MDTILRMLRLALSWAARWRGGVVSQETKPDSHETADAVLVRRNAEKLLQLGDAPRPIVDMVMTPAEQREARIYLAGLDADAFIAHLRQELCSYLLSAGNHYQTAVSLINSRHPSGNHLTVERISEGRFRAVIRDHRGNVWLGFSDGDADRLGSLLSTFCNRDYFMTCAILRIDHAAARDAQEREADEFAWDELRTTVKVDQFPLPFYEQLQRRTLQ